VSLTAIETPTTANSEAERRLLLNAPLSQVFSHLTGIAEDRIYRDEHRFPCAFHEDRVPSLLINDRRSVGFCFGCGIRFNRLQLFRLLGVKIYNYSSRFSHGGDGLSVTIQRELRALNQLGRGREAKAILDCITRYEVRRFGPAAAEPFRQFSL
jgi:hypothetical protein